VRVFSNARPIGEKRADNDGETEMSIALSPGMDRGEPRELSEKFDTRWATRLGGCAPRAR
jgi:hypothetical protein